MKNYKVEATMYFKDKEHGIYRKKGAQFICTEQRYNVLIENNVAKLVEIIEPDKDTTNNEKDVIIKKSTYKKRRVSEE